jgi:hypothetical protein
MSQANNDSATGVLINFAGRRAQEDERRKRERDWQFADLASRFPRDVVLAIMKAAMTDSEEPLTPPPIRCRQRTIDTFRAERSRAAEQPPAKVLTLRFKCAKRPRAKRKRAGSTPSLMQTCGHPNGSGRTLDRIPCDTGSSTARACGVVRRGNVVRSACGSHFELVAPSMSC